MRGMRSKEVAELAGVSVRTLRHYHQIGLLPEPTRSGNGYRHYALVHVARLLRIRRLADLGIPLDRMPDLLADTGSPALSAADVLTDLDGELETQVERLQEQRRQIAQLLADGRRPDLPPGPSVSDLIAEISPAIADLERDAGIVVASLGSETYAEDLLRMGEAITHADADGELSAVVVRFRDLDPTAPDDEVRAVAFGFAKLLGAVMCNLRSSDTGRRLALVPPGQLPTLLGDPRLNPAQLEALTVLSYWIEAGGDVSESDPRAST